jgi:serine/threonine-protein kinase HipA
MLLDVHLEGIAAPVGRLARGEDGAVQFHYLTDALPHPLTLSLLLREQPYGDAEARGFFSNLLFENTLRDQVMERYVLDFNDVVGLLFHLGRDCPGAISCVPEGEGPAKQPGNLATDYDALDDETLAEIMTSLRDRRRLPDTTRDPSPLAGVQGKIALTRLPDGRFALPKPDRNVPTTHILKVPRLRDMGDVASEHLATRLMSELQTHPVSQTKVLGGGALQGLLITRFDRVISGSNVTRMHQEDFAQALGLGPSLKYERNGTPERRFSAEASGRVLRETANPGLARMAFLDVTLVNLLLGNTDNHAKNHALLYTGARPTLAPAYDIFPTLIDAEVTHQLSFNIGSAVMTDEITPADLDAFILNLGFPRFAPALRRHVQSLLRSAIKRIDSLQGLQRKQIGDVIAEQARSLATAAALEIAIPERDAIILNRP